MKLTSRELRKIIVEEIQNVMENLDFGFLSGISNELEKKSSEKLRAWFNPTRRSNPDQGLIKVSKGGEEYEVFVSKLGEGSVKGKVKDSPSGSNIGSFTAKESADEIVRKILEIL